MFFCKKIGVVCEFAETSQAPWGIDIDQKNGVMYVAEQTGRKIIKITPQGIKCVCVCCV